MIFTYEFGDCLIIEVEPISQFLHELLIDLRFVEGVLSQKIFLFAVFMSEVGEGSIFVVFFKDIILEDFFVFAKRVRIRMAH